MSKPPFGFGPSDPDKRGENDPSEPSGAEAFNQLGQMLSQLGQMLSQAGTSSGPVNYDLAKQIALQTLGSAGNTGESKLGFRGGDDANAAVRDAAHLAELWLDAATVYPAGATSTVAWSPRSWVEKTLPTWQRLCDPVARQVSGAWMEALPEEAKQAAGPLLQMMGQMGGMAFGSQLGNALAQLASEMLTSTEIGLPLAPAGTSALLPANIEKFAEGLELPNSEILVFLAAREAAHQRLFTHVPWLRQRLLATVEEFAHGISVDTSALESLAGRIDPANPASIEEAMSSGLLEPQTTEEQKAALRRLETLLALVEGWVDVVVAEAVGDRLPGADALRETLRRRRATGGPAEQTFATLVGLELRPRRMRDASNLWKLVGDRHGTEKRDGLWSHPDLMPTAEDLDEPIDFADRVGSAGSIDDLDPIAELERTEQAEQAERSEREKDEPPSEEGGKQS
ncbi:MULTISPECIES: zinc-dependent metalloprotease [unclassified Amycolatopsis]|uniref:zinc-dependent metalloprotease n=1 Tax=unclassified Amycolatopsis TaxID=2618356 RepID=UPI0028747396|nr:MULTISPECIES: zinc-dependent metalloprotease [unclassified Amycolatopsis]MDS0139087.1 zinc-dependent metalloprotease [Amycolatopsis sp. 505]MDS0144319.1 zinc-dependent metalloprotease [Amycolatopsis sp. CM201R]